MVRRGPLHESYARTENDFHLCKIGLHMQRDYYVSEAFAELNALDQEWSADEDKLLIHCELNHEGDWLREYRAARRDNSKLFSKTNLTSDVKLRERLDYLKRSNPGRYQLLLQDVEALAGHDMSAVKKGREIQSINRRLRRSFSGARRDVEIFVVKRSGEEGVARGLREALMSVSPPLKDLLGSQKPGPGGDYRIELRETDPTFDAFEHADTHQAFTAQTVTSFCDASEAGDTHRQHASLAESLREEEKLMEGNWNSYTGDLQQRRAEYLSRAEELEAEETERLTTVSKQCEEMDVKLLIRMHRTQLNLEMNRIQRRYRERRREIDRFFDAEEAKLDALRSRHEGTSIRVKQLREQLQIQVDKLSKAFPEEKLGGMLILSEIWGAADIRQHIIKTIAAKPETLLCMPALGCPLVRSSTLKQLTTEVPWAVLESLAGRVAFSPEILQRECRQRRATLAEDLKGMPLNRLREIAAGDACHFPDVLTSELARRSRGSGTDNVVLQPSSLSTAVALVDR
eukprot:Hpha_TRINITY_DN11072_c0_g1::TRINITY_DN11072_c0_g1_i1::g.92739::m.92739